MLKRARNSKGSDGGALMMLLQQRFRCRVWRQRGTGLGKLASMCLTPGEVALDLMMHSVEFRPLQIVPGKVGNSVIDDESKERLRSGRCCWFFLAASRWEPPYPAKAQILQQCHQRRVDMSNIIHCSNYRTRY